MGLYDKLDEIEDKLSADVQDGDNSEPREGVIEQEAAGSDETTNEESGENEQDTSKPDNEAENISDSGNSETEEEETQEENENSLQARLRIAEKQKRDLEAQLTKQQRYGLTPEQEVQKPVEQVNDDPEPNRQENYEEWLEWKDRQIERKTLELDERLGKFEKSTQEKELKKQAINEFQQIENNFKSTVDDYEEASLTLKREIAKSIYLQNPFMSEAQVMEGVNDHILRLASQYYNEGYNPSEALYHLSKSLAPQEPQVQAPVEEKVNDKPDLKRISQNKKKSASPLTAGGKGGQPTVGSIHNMTNAEKARLTDAEWDELLNSGS